MSCWMKEIILDTPTKQLEILLLAPLPVEMDITTHWTDHYQHVFTEWNWHGSTDSTLSLVPTVIVPTPSCEKRVVTSMSVYNPNPGITGTFQIIEHNLSTWISTIIVQRTLNPMDTRTLECICSCCPGVTPQPGDLPWVMVSWDWTLIDVNPIQQIDFASCLRAQYDALTPGIAYVDIDLNPSFLCDFSDISNPIIELSICNDVIDMSCLVWLAGVDFVRNTVYVMKNGDDSTGLVERFDRPFLTINAAISAAVASGGDKTVIVHPWYYNEWIVLKDTVDIHMLKWSRVSNIRVLDNDIVSKVSWDGIIKWEKNIDRWIYIDSWAIRSQIEIECDLIESTNTDNTYIYITNRASLWKLKVRCWALATNSDNKWLQLFDIAGDWSSTDAVTGRFADPYGFLHFFNVQWWELYRHHSEVVRYNNTEFNIRDCQSETTGRVYIDNVFIKMFICQWSEDWLFKARTENSLLCLNDFIVDLYPADVSPAYSKCNLFFSENKGVINFYWLCQFWINKAYEQTLRWNYADNICNIYWRVLTNKPIQDSILNFFIFQWIRTYWVENDLIVKPDMPLNRWYSIS